MVKPPYLEINCIPSQLNTSKPTGVASNLASVADNAPQYDGVTIEQMRGNCLYERGDKIDKVGLAQKSLLDSGMKVKSRAKAIRSFNEVANKVQKQQTSRQLRK